jgi:hypothetical protein
MSLTKQQKRKQQKVNDRKRAIRKHHNVLMNAPAKRYRLDVLLEDGWRVGVREWSSLEQVEKHKTDTEILRGKGDVIARGRVIDLKDGKIITTIPESGIMKGRAPDKIADGVKAKDFEVKDKFGMKRPEDSSISEADGGNV